MDRTIEECNFSNAKMYYVYYKKLYEKFHYDFYKKSYMAFYNVAKEYANLLNAKSLKLSDNEKEMVNKLLTCMTNMHLNTKGAKKQN